MKITEITSIVAIILSVINLGITIKKDFFKPKPQLKIRVKNSKIRRSYDRIEAQMVVNLSVTPLIKFNGIKELYLENTQDSCFDTFSMNNYSRVKANWFYDLYTEDVLEKVKYDEFKDYIESKQKASIEEIVSNVDIPYNFTIMGIFHGNRWPDGYDDFPETGFSIKIVDLFDNAYDVELNLEEIA